MGLKCKFQRLPSGDLIVSENGVTPKVFIDALSVLKNQDKALQAWAVTYTEEFKRQTGKNPEQASFDDVVKFYDVVGSDTLTLNQEEMYSVKEFMRRNRFESLSELNDFLRRAFKPSGVLGINLVEAIGSGIYSQEEIDSLDPADLINILSKVEGHLLKEDFFVVPDNREFNYKDSTQKTLFGTYTKVSESEIDTAILNLIENKEEIYDKIQELPYADFVTRFYSDANFAKNVLAKYKELKKVPLLRLVGNQLTDADESYFVALKNTLLANVDLLSVDAEIDYLKEIDTQLWDISPQEVQKVLQEVEQEMVKVNIDLVGMSKYYQSRDQILLLMDSLSSVLINPSDQNLKTFSDRRKILFNDKGKTADFITVPERYKDLNIVRLDTYLSDNTLFKDYGLIRVADNIFHKVERGQINELYDFLADQVMSGDFTVPVEFKTEVENYEKVNALQDLTKFVNSRDTGLITQFQEEISLNQLAFNHLPVLRSTSVAQDTSSLLDITTDEEYLQTSFVSDFYNYQLQEKAKGSEVYKNVLSKFEVNDADIVMTSEVKSVDDIKYSQELKDYIRLKRDSSMKHLVGASEQIVLDDLMYINNPKLIQPVTTEVISQSGDYLVTKPTSQKYVKFNDTMYRKELVRDDSNLFIRIALQPDTIYYTTNTNFSFDNTSAKKYFDSVTLNIPYSNRELIPSKQEILKAKLNKNEINKIRSSIRMKFKDSDTLDLLDALSKYINNPNVTIDSFYLEQSEAFDEFTQNGISLNNISNLLVEEELFDTKNEAINYLRSIGDYKGMFDTFSGSNIQNTQSFLDSGLELLNLYSEKEALSIRKNTQDCG